MTDGKQLFGDFVLGLGVVWITGLIVNSGFYASVPAAPLIGRVGLVAGLTAVAILFVLRKWKTRLIPISF